MHKHQFTTAPSPTVRGPASNDARNFSSWKNESQPGYKRNSLGSLRVNSKRKHIVDSDAHNSSHDERSDDDDITIASNIVQPASQCPEPQISAPQILESAYQTHRPDDSTPTVFIKSDDGPFFDFNRAHISEY